LSSRIVKVSTSKWNRLRDSGVFDITLPLQFPHISPHHSLSGKFPDKSDQKRYLSSQNKQQSVHELAFIVSAIEAFVQQYLSLAFKLLHVTVLVAADGKCFPNLAPNGMDIPIIPHSRSMLQFNR
jgi:hypothetical protein